MAFLRVSIAVILLLLHLSSSHFSHQPPKFVKGDDTLIHVECHNAEVPETCIQCLKSDPRSEQSADAIAIATIVIDCLAFHANALEGNMSMLASSIHDAALKEVYGDCRDWFSYAKRDLYAATLGLKNHDYDTADHSVYTAFSYRVSCGREIGSQNSTIQIPSRLLYELGIYEELSEAAMRIIDRLE